MRIIFTATALFFVILSSAFAQGSGGQMHPLTPSEIAKLKLQEKIYAAQSMVAEGVVWSNSDQTAFKLVNPKTGKPVSPFIVVIPDGMSYDKNHCCKPFLYDAAASKAFARAPLAKKKLKVFQTFCPGNKPPKFMYWVTGITIHHK